LARDGADRASGILQHDGAADIAALLLLSRASVQAIQKEIDAFPMPYIRSKDGGRKYREMQAARALDLDRALVVATKLRLTNQSRYTAKTAATESKHALHDDKFPWEA